MTLLAEHAEVRVGEHAEIPSRAEGSVGRGPGLLLLAAGAFFVTLALLLRFYVYAQLAVLPVDLNQAWTLEDPQASYLDTATWQTRRDVEVTQRTELAGRSMPGNDDWAVWTVTVDTATPQDLIDHRDRKVIVDRATATAVNCCGEHVDGDFAVRQAGLVALWPVDAQGTEFPFYDADMRSAPVMRLEAADEVGGIPARRYAQSVPATQVPGSARQVPAAELGLDRSGTVSAARWVELARTYWVEPVSGQVLDITEQRRETLRTADGAGERLILEADFAMRSENVTANIQRAGDRSRLLLLVRDWLPLTLGAVGGLLVLTGTVRALRHG